MVERINPSIYFSDDPAFDAEKFANASYKIKTGECPNGCGLLNEDESGQACEKCGFFTNTKNQLTKQ